VRILETISPLGISTIMEQECPHCERLKLAAVEASRAYHDIMADLESAHIIKHDDKLTLALREGMAKALLSRNVAISELTAHESTHKRAKSMRA
jgi:hypothetical protein